VTALPDLRRERARVCRLDPAAALETLDDAEAFLRDRGMLTRLADCSLPSLFEACHEEPYKPGSRGFGLWPRTKWPWAFELAERPGIHVLAVHRGKGLFVTVETASRLDPLAREELGRIEDGALGPEAARVVSHLAAAGPSLLEELREELGVDARRLRPKLERRAAVVARAVVRDAGNTSELSRWDQVFEDPAGGGGLGDLLVAGVRAAVVVPEDEVETWFSWRAPAALVDRLVDEGRLVRPEPGWISAAETSSPRAPERPGPSPRPA
jgi:hypothetical protein